MILQSLHLLVPLSQPLNSSWTIIPRGKTKLTQFFLCAMSQYAGTAVNELTRSLRATNDYVIWKWASTRGHAWNSSLIPAPYNRIQMIDISSLGDSEQPLLSLVIVHTTEKIVPAGLRLREERMRRTYCYLAQVLSSSIFEFVRLQRHSGIRHSSIKSSIKARGCCQP